MEFVKPDAIRILKEEKKRRYDHVFWSCDGYEKQTDGYLKPNGQSDYADQVRLYMYLIRLCVYVCVCLRACVCFILPFILTLPCHAQDRFTGFR